MYQRTVSLYGNGGGHKTAHQVQSKGMCITKELKKKKRIKEHDIQRDSLKDYCGYIEESRL